MLIVEYFDVGEITGNGFKLYLIVLMVTNVKIDILPAQLLQQPDFLVCDDVPPRILQVDLIAGRQIIEPELDGQMKLHQIINEIKIEFALLSPVIHSSFLSVHL